MLIKRLYLRNYRVYEEPVDLEMPAGLVGVYGVNGAGKSALLESVLWTFWGKARTSKDQVRTAGVGGDCVTEVEFEHEGHLYLVRRTLSGVNATVRAEAHADRAQVAEGVGDTGRYLHSVLGMDDAAFRASVFAEQKQLAAFSLRRPAERRQLVLGLLGITPLDGARDQARADARAANAHLDQLRAVLADVGQLESEAAAERSLAESAAAKEVEAAAAAQRAGAALAEAEAEAERLDALARAWEALVAEGRIRRDERDSLARHQGSLEAEDRRLSEDEAALPALAARAGGLEADEGRLRLVEAVVEARSALDRAASELPPDPPVEPDLAAVAGAVEVAQAARSELAELEGRMAGARAQRERAAAALASAGQLSGEADCPLCGQALGPAYEAVRAHRAEELRVADLALAGLAGQRDRAAEVAAAASASAREAQAGLERSREGWRSYQRALDRRLDAEGRLEKALAAWAGPSPAGSVPADAGLPGPGLAGVGLPGPEELRALGARVARAREAQDAAAQLRGRLQRRPAVTAELAEIARRVAELDAELAGLRERVSALGYRPEDLTGAVQARAGARQVAAAAASAAQIAAVAGAETRTRAEAADRRLEEARAQHQRLAEAVEEARHLGRTAELLNAFRNSVVARVGPRLSAQAAELFGELTDHEYDLLKVDPETYELQIQDEGSLYGMDRFSGSETDLANLALRVAISEQVQLQSGGAVGLLVLDEVFGPLDADRKERMLLALERLRGRFRQVLVVTHDADIKEQLPCAIEVLKLAGRRATARVAVG